MWWNSANLTVAAQLLKNRIEDEDAVCSFAAHRLRRFRNVCPDGPAGFIHVVTQFVWYDRRSCSHHLLHFLSLPRQADQRQPKAPQERTDQGFFLGR